MPTSVRFATLAEIAASIKTRLESLQDGDGADRFAQVVRYHGTRLSEVRQAFEHTVAVPACIVMPGIGDMVDASQGGAQKMRESGFVLFVATEAFVITEDNDFAAVADLADAVMEGFLPAQDSLSTPYVDSLGCRYHPAGWAAIEFSDVNYDVIRINLAVWDCRKLRNDDGTPVA